jgi:hypothetical protein
MEATLLLFVPLVIFRIYLGILHIRIYWKMLKRKRFWDYLVAWILFKIMIVPLKYPDNFPDRDVLKLTRCHDGLVKYFYLKMFLTGVAFALAYRLIGIH